MSRGVLRRSLAGGGATGMLLVLAFPPFELGFVPFLALVPFALAVEGLPPGTRGRRDAFLTGAAAGGVAWAVLLYWIPLSLGRFWGWAFPGYLAAVAALAAVTGLAGWALHALRTGTGATGRPPSPDVSPLPAIPLWLALPLAWTAGEWLRANLPGPLAFPWLELSVSLAHAPPLVGAAELVGSRGVSFLVAAANGLLATAVLRWDRPPAAAAWTGAALLVPGLMAGWGTWRAGALAYETLPPVAVVETAVPQPVKLDRTRVAEATLAALVEAMSGEAAEARLRDAAVVVLPEAVLPVDLRGEDGAEVRRFLEGRARASGTPLLVGGVGRVDGAPVNAVYLVSPREGLLPGGYEKRRLVPFVERVPLVPVPGLGLQGRFGSYRPGEGWPLARIVASSGAAAWSPGGVSVRAGQAASEPLAVGAFVCFESTFGSVARALRGAGAELLVNLTNDAWLGGDGTLPATAALRQHPAHLVLRAVETRTPVIRAANTGPSVMADPSGRAVVHPPVVQPGLRDFIPRTTSVRTLFVRLGDVVGAGSAVVVLLMVLGGMGWTRWRRHTAC